MWVERYYYTREIFLFRFLFKLSPLYIKKLYLLIEYCTHTVLRIQKCVSVDVFMSFL